MVFYIKNPTGPWGPMGQEERAEYPQASGLNDRVGTVVLKLYAISYRKWKLRTQEDSKVFPV